MRIEFVTLIVMVINIIITLYIKNKYNIYDEPIKFTYIQTILFLIFNIIPIINVFILSTLILILVFSDDALRAKNKNNFFNRKW